MNPDELGARLPVLRGHDVLLRPLAAADADVVFQLFSDAAVVRFMSIRRLTTLDDAEQFIASIDRDFTSGSLYQWGVELDGVFAGTCTLAGIDRNVGTAQVGFAVLPGVQRRGIASRAVALMMDFAFDRLGLRYLEAHTDMANTASMKLLGKLGFVREPHPDGRDFCWVKRKPD
jgi:ribosomal-protein-alanine N-acetyltransferase